jgi:predicted MFS family arabinose efflux permease
MVLLAYGIVQTDHHGWGSGRTLGLLAAAAALIVLFLLVEALGKDPLVRLSIFRVRALTMANLVCVVAMGTVMPLFLFVTIYVQEILGFDPIEAGFAFLPYMTLVLAGSALSAVLMRRIGIRTVLIAGLVIAIPGLLLMSRIHVGGGYASEVLPALSLLGIGMGLVLVPVTLTATASVGAKDSGLASGLYNTSLQIGGALGIAVLSTIAQHQTAAAAVPGPEALIDGYQLAFVVGACALAVGAVLVAAGLRRSDVDDITVDASAVALAASG